MALKRTSLTALIRGCLTGFALVCSVAPFTAEAQPTASTRVIGFLGNGNASTSGPNITAFNRGLRDLGWIEGKTVRIEYRWAEGNSARLPELAAELARLKVDVLVVAGPPAIVAARQATSTMPIVIGVLLADPVRLGFAKSLARPGGNITGMASQYEDIVGKQVQLLTEALPGLSRLFVLRDVSHPPLTSNVAVAAARTLGLQVEVLKVSAASEYEGAFRTARNAGGGAMLVLPSATFNTHRRQLIDLEARYRLPAIHGFRDFVQDGSFMSYGVNLAEMFRSATSHIDRILRGARAGDLPMERANTFELVLNLRTARTLGLTIPPALLLRADHVIE